MKDEDKIVGYLKMDYKEMRSGKYVLDEDEKPIVKKYELKLTRKHLSVLKTIMMEREKEVAIANMGNVRNAQEEDKMLKQLYEVLGYE